MSDNVTVVPQGETRYPRSAAVYLLSDVNEKAGKLALLFDELALRRQQLGAEADERLPASGLDYLSGQSSRQTSLTAMVIEELVKLDQKLAEKRAAEAEHKAAA
jgi:hypothetical protein